MCFHEGEPGIQKTGFNIRNLSNLLAYNHFMLCSVIEFSSTYISLNFGWHFETACSNLVPIK